MILRIFLFLFIATFVQTSYGQNTWCGTDYYNNKLLQNLSAEEAAKVQARHRKIFQKSNGQNSKSGTVYTIPLVVHVIHDNCEGNISKEQIEDGIAVLNEDFRRQNSDTNNTRSIFKSLATDVEIRFELANIDPNGKCTEGIVRLNSELTHDADNAVKSLSSWPSSKYMNVWLVESIDLGNGPGTLGYAQFPGGGSWSTYGLVVINSHWGRIGTSNADGRTSTHEIGHCLGLLHTFQSGCGSNCSNSGDWVCDTPPVSTATWGCSQSQNSCSNDTWGSNSPFTTNVVDMIENYMSYDNCQNMFTLEQASGMRASLTQYAPLITLVSSSNLLATGTNPGYIKQVCTPIADYCMQQTSICEGNSLKYIDRSYNGIVTGRNWSFPGGTPASSSDSVVDVTYTIPGLYDVSLTVSNISGSKTKTENDFVNVDPTDANFSHFRYDENFEDQQRFDSLWRTLPDGNKNWKLSTDAAYSGVRSSKFFNFVNAVEGYTTDLITPSYNLSAVFLPKLFFKVAFARKSISSSDNLRIHYSNDCGESWNMMAIKTAGSLESVSGYRTSNWAPANLSEWAEHEVKISSFLAAEDNVRFKFEFISGGGNNIYIDDVNITSITGVEDYTEQNNLLIYPNPTSGLLNIDVLNTRSDLGKIAIKNVAGQTVFQQEFSNGLKKGSKETINVSTLRAGIYFIEFIDLEGGKTIKKVIIQ